MQSTPCNDFCALRKRKRPTNLSNTNCSETGFAYGKPVSELLGRFSLRPMTNITNCAMNASTHKQQIIASRHLELHKSLPNLVLSSSQWGMPPTFSATAMHK